MTYTTLALAAAAPARAQQQGAPAEARVLHVHERVEVNAAPAAEAQVLRAGAQVATREGSYATVGCGASALQMEAQTHLVMFDPAGAPAGARDTSLTRGAVRVRVGDASLALRTPGGTVTMARGEYRVQVDASRDTRVVVYRGRARVSAGPRAFVMGAGTGARVNGSAPGEAVYEPVPVPRAPTWARPFPARVLVGGGTASVEARYAPPRGQRHPPRRWAQVIARDADFDDVVFAREVNGGDTRFAAEALPVGEYFARVMSVDAEHYESAASEARRFAIAGPRVTPGGRGRPAEVSAPAGVFCRLDGATELAAGAAVALVPGRDHALACSLSADLRDPVRTEIPAEQAGELAHEVSFNGRWDPEGGSVPIAIRLRDGSGQGYPYATVAVNANPGVVVERVREESERGAYVTRVTWDPNTPVVLEFVVNRTLRFTERFGGAGAAAAAP